MELKGKFILDGLVEVENSITNEGLAAYLSMVTQASEDVIASDGQFFIGLCMGTYGRTSTLADITNEPTTGDYSRQAVARSEVGWPSISLVAGRYRAVSAPVTFLAAGADFTPFDRLFLASVVSGSAGKLLAVSAPLSTGPITINSGTSRRAQYVLDLG